MSISCGLAPISWQTGLEANLKTITEQVLSATPDSIESRIEGIRKFVAERLESVLDMLRKDTALARTEILKHTTEITMTPEWNVPKPFYVAEGNWDLLGANSGLDRGRQDDDWRPRMVRIRSFGRVSRICW